MFKTVKNDIFKRYFFSFVNPFITFLHYPNILKKEADLGGPVKSNQWQNPVSLSKKKRDIISINETKQNMYLRIGK